ncbi:type IV pilus assembly protein PilW [Rhodoferax sp. OV413]|uniref:PilW family protein n=1 Tax=Rhodoferax sp. OV413 TaxID=1855285 RepID=UPI000889065C|nr:PilW family protein [Rhodoferax sp. OV413]SDO33923.1 type IV pilus assembly protein PilW [Rhodoferax sp. OV413]
MKHNKLFVHQRGVTLIELMVTIAITLFLVAAAAYVYLGTRETQRAIDRNGSNAETGTFVLQLIGRDIMKAGYYPANISRVTTDEGFPKLAGFPPTKDINNNALATDWTPPTPQSVYLSGLFGCDGAQYDPTATPPCGTPSANEPDSLVVNYFTNDNMGVNVGDRFDCSGADVANSASNGNRLNTVQPLQAPLQPLFVSNRYAISAAKKTQIDQQEITTRSFACVGNGSGDNAGSTGIPYQPILAGIEDMQITYGVFAATANQDRRTPDKYYTATEVSNLATVSVEFGALGVTPLPPWSRVVSVRVCVMTKSVGAAPKIADKAGVERKYLDCKGVEQTQAASDSSLRKRFVQEFAVRNRLNQTY